MLNSLFRAVFKLAVLLALVRFVILPMLPGTFHFPSPTDLFKDPIKVVQDISKQARDIVAHGRLPGPGDVTGPIRDAIPDGFPKP